MTGLGGRRLWPPFRFRLIAAIIAIVATLAIVLLVMGRAPICTCGTVRLWEGAVNSPGNSQHLTDWYSFSHIVHGLIFYGATWWLLRGRLATDMRLLVAVLVESAWEMLENSPLIIERYRSATIALGYTGDSVINSLSDVTMMVLGFLFAARAPIRISVLLGLALELLMLFAIRDNLTLNIVMLIWPVDAIRAWQAGLS
ncbi:Protein of unknown function [Sphingomonas sp. YR710]|uniref:DUF2585 domain-containing protein n=1 Tax=Sphingomonas sp. YR710 TaxID=1882773 RepID=UPI000883C13F|nr:DUF2585 domain-containing protein [Sphingomonas sp. YR710]SDC52211.1 Protein of unknown function [Sphingomonas sp. YR710]